MELEEVLVLVLALVFGENSVSRASTKCLLTPETSSNGVGPVSATAAGAAVRARGGGCSDPPCCVTQHRAVRRSPTGSSSGWSVHFATANGQRASAFIVLADQADLRPAYAMRDASARGWFVYQTLRDHADRTQPAILALLGQRKTRYVDCIVEQAHRDAREAGEFCLVDMRIVGEGIAYQLREVDRT